jgi:cellulose synthase/poly-beta-1,6-N-acetylglucosamine synthase-like glycosyltransferase
LAGIELLIKALFIVSGGMLAYAYLFYPILLAILPSSADASTRCATDDDWPTISLIVSAHNEAATIRARIQNFTEGHYPGWSELIVVSDGSTDATADEATAVASERVRVLARPQRCGKAAALDAAVERALGEILVFSDATSIFDPDALTNLARRFADPTVGLVTGKVKAHGSEIVKLYHRYERYIERLEADKGVLVTAHGCIYAMRRALWRHHDPALVDDFLAPILASLSAKRAVAAQDAVCEEEFPADVQFDRQVRMVTLAAVTFFRLFPDLVRGRRYMSLLALSSHKLLRWFTVVWLVLLGGTTCWLLPLGGVFLVAAMIQAFFWIAVGIGALTSRNGTSTRVTFAYQFVAMNAAALVGLYRYWRGHIPMVWETNAQKIVRV